MVWRGTRRGSVYDGFGDEVGQQPIAGKRVVTAVVDVKLNTSPDVRKAVGVRIPATTRSKSRNHSP
jgi:hypothetical protein